MYISSDTPLSMQAVDIPLLIESDESMMRVLRAARLLHLPDWWIGAGFVRNKIWDVLSGNTQTPPGDIDVVYFDPSDLSEETEQMHQNRLEEILPTGKWSVTNQARMHTQNGDEPYTSSLDAIAHWPETATAVAVTLDDANRVRFEAPLGSDDLLNLVIRPSPTFAQRPDAFHVRLAKKMWEKKWPNIQIISP